MSATWMQHQARHPWFHSFATKRKHWPNCDSMAVKDADASRPIKRRRCSTLERGFAHLSLVGGPAIAEDVEDVEMSMASSDVKPRVGETPDLKDVKMRKSTWYEREPDRIVVTELETSSDEETETQEGEGGLYVSPALLKHIRSHTLDSSLKRSTSQALVLYQPATISMDTASPSDKKLMIDGQDAMDLEP
ncbi:hypothetical protein APHAL10511_000067 [Amanita phalloides]|nr:hypothetical protein APHAL10511_000067 [Amanita phalloides]